jgi:tight adherence protein B
VELILVYAAIFIGALIFFERLTGLLAKRFQRTKSLNYRMKLLETADSQLDVYQEMVRERALDYEGVVFRPARFIRRLFAQSGLKLNLPKIAIYMLGGAVLLWLFLRLLGVPPAWRGVVLVSLLGALPSFYVLRVRATRMRKFTLQLPGALDVVNRSLSSGHPLPTAISLVSRELPDPIGTEFGMLSDELTYGTDLDHAMLNMIERAGVEDLKLLAVSMSVQRGTGGNLVEALENLSNVIRERAVLRAKVKALSAEGRITAIIMSAFPFLLYFMINALAPTYFDPVWESGYSNLVLAVAFSIMIVGNVILYRLVNFKF